MFRRQFQMTRIPVLNDERNLSWQELFVKSQCHLKPCISNLMPNDKKHNFQKTMTKTVFRKTTNERHNGSKRQLQMTRHNAKWETLGSKDNFRQDTLGSQDIDKRQEKLVQRQWQMKDILGWKDNYRRQDTLGSQDIDNRQERLVEKTMANERHTGLKRQ